MNIKNIIIKNNLTQTEFAKSINTVQSVISAYETGETLIKTSFMLDICKKYKVSMDWIVGRTNTKYLK